VIEKELQLKPEEFDKQFLAWLEPQVQKTVDNFDDWGKRLRANRLQRESQEMG